jgi:methylmalonyl-CoA mutase
VYGTSAARFDDDGVTALYQELRGALAGKGLALSSGVLPRVDVRASTGLTSVLPPSAVTYLGEVAATVRAHHQQTARQVEAARTRQHLTTARALLDGEAVEVLDAAIADAEGRLDPWTTGALEAWPATVEQYAGDELVYVVRGKDFRTPLRRTSLSGRRCRGSRCRARRTTASSCGSCARRACPGRSRSPLGCSRSSARVRRRRGCSPARATRSAPTAASSCCPPATRRRACRRRSTP